MAKDNKNEFVSPSAHVSFPSQLDPFEAKIKKDWGLKLAQSIQSEWFYGFNVTGGVLNSKFNTMRIDFTQRRMYAKGLQSMDKYKEQFKADGDKSFLNLSAKPISIIPKNIDIVVNGMADRGYSVKATSIDPIGYSERISYRERIENDMNAKDIILKAKESLGVDVGSMPIDQLPETEDELNLHMQLEYKQDIELSEELAIESVFNENLFNETTDRMIKRDLAVCGLAWAKHKFVPDKGIVVEYVNCENKIQSYSEDPYFRDCFYHGEFKIVPISEVLIEFQWLNEPGNEAIRERIASSSVAWWDYNLIAQNQRIKGTTNLLYFTYKTTRKRAQKIKEKATGEKIVSKADETFVLKEGQKEDYKRVSIEEEILMEGVYVLGTDILLKWEVAENMSRPKSNRQKVIDQYIGCAPSRERGYIDSLVARMIPVEDKLNVIELKAEQIIQKMQPDGYIIDPMALAEVDLGGGNVLSVQNVWDMFTQTGSIIASSYGSSGDPMYSKPITELKMGGSLDKLNALAQERMIYLDQLRDVIGLNKASDASTPDKESLVGVQKLASLNSNIATKHILKGASYITLRLAEAVCYRVADLIKYSDLRDDFARKIGVTSVKTLESVKNLHLYDFGIKLELELDEEERAKLENDISLEIQKGTMVFEDKYKILNIKNFKLAIQYASILRTKREKKLQEQKMADIQANAQSQMQSAQQAEQFRQQTIQMEAQAKGQLQQMINEGEMQKEQLRGEQDRETLKMKIQGDIAVAQTVNGAKMQKLDFLENKKDERLTKQASLNSEMIQQRHEKGESIDFEAKEAGDGMFELEPQQ